MKKYYLVAEPQFNGGYSVFVTDNAKGREILKEIETDSYAEAVKQFSLKVWSNGRGAFCGVDRSGNPFHG